MKRRTSKSSSLEVLERREVMTSALGLAQFLTHDPAAIVAQFSPVMLLSDGTMSIVADQYENTVTISGNRGAYLNGEYFALDGPATRIEFWGGPGPDQFTNNTSLPTKAWGNGGHDVLRGGRGTNELYGGAGDDLLEGNVSDDVLFGGDGVDTLRGFGGVDRLYGGAHNDVLVGGPDSDVLKGGSGNDLLFGQDGDDSLYGESGHDDLYGNAGNNLLYGGPGVDYLHRGERGYVDAGDPSMDAFVPFEGNARSAVTMDSYSRDDLLSPTYHAGMFHMDNYWSDYRQQFSDAVVNYLTSQRFNGQSLYETQLNLASYGNMEIRDSESGIELRYTLSGNHLSTYSTQPTPLGSWADPKFSINFDLALTVTLSHAAPIQVINAYVEVPSATLRAENVAADVGLFVQQLMPWLSGSAMSGMQQALKGINAPAFRNVLQQSLNTQMQQLNIYPSLAYDAEREQIILRVVRQGDILPSPDPWANLFKFNKNTKLARSTRSDWFVDELTRVPDDWMATGIAAATVEQPSDIWDRLYTEVAIDANDPLGPVALNPQPLPPQQVDLMPVVATPDDTSSDLVSTWQDVVFEEDASVIDFYATVYTPPALTVDAQDLMEWNGVVDDWSLGEDLIDASVFSGDLDWSALNPQPLPPRELQRFDDTWGTMLGELELPLVDMPETVDTNILDQVGLNPQPLPPKESDPQPLTDFAAARITCSLHTMTRCFSTCRRLSIVAYRCCGKSFTMCVKAKLRTGCGVMTARIRSQLLRRGGQMCFGRTRCNALVVRNATS